MSEDIREKGREFAKFLEGLSEEEKKNGNESEVRRVHEEHSRFKKAYDANECYLCNKSLNSFSKKRPCIHWLLKPKGFKKKDVLLLAENYGLFQIQSLLRWYANETGFAKNINDLTDEGTGNKLIELTIKYKNIEWSFSCAESDYMGHENSQHSKHPHYHFQMRVDKRPFINFNDFHLALNEADIINIESMRSNPNLIKQGNSFGEGISDLFNENVIEEMLTSVTMTNDPDEAEFKIDSVVMADEGMEIKGEDIYKLMVEAKDKGVTVASLLHKLPNSKTEVMVSPGPGVVEQAPRTGRKKKT